MVDIRNRTADAARTVAHCFWLLLGLAVAGIATAAPATLTRVEAPAIRFNADGSKGSLQVTLNPSSYIGYAIDLPSNVASLRVTTTAAGGEIDLFVKRGVPHAATTLQGLTTESAFTARTAGANETLEVSRAQGIGPGRWWVAPLNAGSTPVTLTLDMNFTGSGSAFVIRPGQSGSWFDPAKSGQGYFFQILDGGLAIVAWFTFDPAGQQVYFIGVGQVNGDRVTITDLQKTRGARFGAAFDPNAVVREDYGDLTMVFDSCGRGYASFAPSVQGWPHEQLNITRLTTLSGMACTSAPAPTAAAKALGGGMSGAWFEQARAGEGWMVEVLGPDLALVYFFTYTPDGRQAWFGNVGRIVDGSIIVDNAIQPVGGRFGPNFNPSQITNNPWGGFALTFTDCGEAVAFAGGPASYGTQSYGNVIRLSGVSSLNPCAIGGNPANVNGSATAIGGTFVDGDVNAPEQANVDNDTAAQAQLVSNPATVSGFATATATGIAGDRFANASDVADAYRATMSQGQVVRLAVSDHNAGNPTSIDLDLLLFATSDPNNPVATSEGTGPDEQLTVPADGSYFVVVIAFRGKSNYVLSIDSLPALTSVPGALSRFAPQVPDEIVAEFTDTDDTGSEAKARAKAVTLAQRLGLQLKAGVVGRPVLLQVADAKAARAALGVAPLAKAGPFVPADPAQRRQVELIELIKALRARGEVRFAEPNGIVQPMAVPNDQFYPLQWHYPAINLPQAWDLTTGSSNVVVAVIDTGVVSHPDLAGNLQTNLGADLISSASVSLDGDGIDRNADDDGDQGFPNGTSTYHGTHVAGTVAARGNNGSGVAGVGWSTALMPVRVLGRGGGTDFDVAQGIRWAAGASTDLGTVTRKADVINMSLGGASATCPQSYANAVATARAAGTIVIAAAGNDATSFPSVPATCPGVVSVSAVERRLALSPYSNFGAGVDVAAPGGDITADRDGDTYPDGVLSTHAFDGASGRQVNLDFLQGTSMAAPHVAGVAALMRAAFPGLTPAQFDTALSTGALTRDLANNGASVRDDQFGYGLIDAFKAVVEARRLGGSGTVPPALGANVGALDFGAALTQQTLVLSNLGQGTLTVSSVTGNRPWLSVQPAQVTNGLGSYTVSVNRAGLMAGAYQGQLAIAASTGNFSIPVAMRVGNISAGNAGVLFVLLVDQVTGNTVAQDDATSTTGTYAFGFSGIRPGNYYVFAGTDLDNDFTLCDAGEICGALGTLSDPAVVRVNGSTVTLAPFPSLPDVGGTGVSSNAATGDDVIATRDVVPRRLR